MLTVTKERLSHPTQGALLRASLEYSAAEYAGIDYETALRLIEWGRLTIEQKGPIVDIDVPTPRRDDGDYISVYYNLVDRQAHFVKNIAVAFDGERHKRETAWSFAFPAFRLQLEKFPVEDGERELLMLCFQPPGLGKMGIGIDQEGKLYVSNVEGRAHETTLEEILSNPAIGAVSL